MKKTYITLLLICAASLCASAQQFSAEKLSRGFAGIASRNGYHLSWRMLPSDNSGASFDIYRETDGGKAVKVNSKAIRITSDFVDTSADLSRDNRWILKSAGKELASWSLKGGKAAPYIEIPVNKPEARDIFRVTQRAFGTSDSYNPGDASDRYSFSAGDCSVGDLDGDGELEIILKWNPSNLAQPEKTGVTGNTILDAYKIDGTQLWRIDLGHNVRSTFASVPFIVYDLDGDGCAELVCKTADGSVDGLGKVLGNPRADWRSMDEASETFGRAVVGPEFITVFDGKSGKAIDSKKFNPIRFPLESWGGIGGSDEYGIKSEYLTAGVAYLDGKTPSAFFVRGGQARTVVATWKFDGRELISNWTFDSSKSGLGAYSGNGGTSVAVADFDGDGADEICVGAMIVGNDGNGLCTTKLRGGAALHAGALDPSRKGIQIFGIHDNSGVIGAFLENPAMAMYDGKTGEVIWSKGIGETIGRGVAADIDPRSPGAEVWVGSVDPEIRPGRWGMMAMSSPKLPEYSGALKGLYSASGEKLSDEAPYACNFTIYWDSDPQAELLDGTSISKWNWKREGTEELFKAEGVKAINGTKAVPCFSGDILGDWREEVVFITNDESSLRIYITDIEAVNRTTTLLCDRQYRLSLVWQNAGHNQPPHTSFDMAGKLK